MSAGEYWATADSLAVLGAIRENCPVLARRTTTTDGTQLSAPTSDRAGNLAALAVQLRTVHADREYYSVSLTLTIAGHVEWGVYSHFEGYEDPERRIELRAASIVHADRLLANYEKLGEECLVVNDDRGLAIFMSRGGHAVIERKLAEQWLPDVLAPHPSVSAGPIGFRGLSTISEAERQRAPSRKLRMSILKRDHYSCRICGERPADNVHVKLHLHHVRMWSRGGLTEEANLLTICQTCHDGLDPHEDLTLSELIPGWSFSSRLAKRRSAHMEGVERYRKKVLETWPRDEKSNE